MFNLSKTPNVIKLAAEHSPQMKIVCVDGDVPEMMVMDYIGEDGWGGGVPASEVIAFSRKHKGKDISVRFNSLGGSAFEGIVMHNALQEHDGKVTAYIDGVAFSAASFAAVGAGRIVMQAASSFGIHRAGTIAIGNAKTFRGVTEWLDAIDAHQVSIFANKTGKDEATVNSWLDGTDDGTLFSADEALAVGFADEVIPLAKRETVAAVKSIVAFARIAAELKLKRMKAINS